MVVILASSARGGPIQTTARFNKTFFWAAAAAALLAVFDHGYLLSEYVKFQYGGASGEGLCNISETFSCAAVSASKYSAFLGVPMALWGLVANLVLVLLFLYYPMSENKTAARRNLLLVASLIAASSLVMAAISSFLISRYCPFCIVAYVLSFVCLGLLWMALPKQAPSVSGSAFKFSDLTPVLVLGGIAFIAGFVVNDQIAVSYGMRDMAPMVRDAIEGWRTNSQLQFQTVEPLAIGAAPDKAKMTIVEFADFRCIHCKHAAPVLKAFTNAHSDVRLEFQTWPLDGECNTSITQRNGASCLLARTVFCAQKISGKGWQAHDYVFANFERWIHVDAIRGGIKDLATAIAAPMDQLNSCADSPEMKTQIEKMAAVGTSLNMQGTPMIVANGKKLPNGQIMPILKAAYESLK